MTSTPPATTLSTPSPTERALDEDDTLIPSTSALEQMNTFMAKKPIYLIVATAQKPHLGIGLKGQLPWPQIKSDMTFFRKATTGKAGRTSSPDQKLNAVVMGRKTYESIPLKFRPLENRVNVILTRRAPRELADKVLRELTGGQEGREPAEYRLVDRATVGGLPHEVVSIVKRDHTQATVMVTDSLDKAVGVIAEDVFCIGGAEVYTAVLKDNELRTRVRILDTRVRKIDGGEFDCDTFWPEEMEDGKGWKGVEGRLVEEWVGVDVPQGKEEWKRDEKAGVEIQTAGWERTEI